MTADTAVLAGRALAASLMSDTCSIGRPNGRTVNPSTGEVSTTSSSVYIGPCRVRPNAVQAAEEAAGERLIVTRSYVVSVPADQSAIEVGDVVTVTACPLDEQLVGAVLKVRDVTKGSQITARRLTCEEQET